MQNLHLNILLMCCLLGTSGCSNDADSYYPLEPGTRWRYSVELTNMNGLNEQKFVVQAAPPRVWQDEPRPLRVTLDGTRLYYDKNEQGVFRLASQHRFEVEPTPIADNRRTVLKKPFTVGTRWREATETITLARIGPPQRSEYAITAPVLMTYEIEATDATVTVPAGRFSGCLQVHGTGQQLNYDAGNYIGRTDINIDKIDWYAPGVGLVKSVRKETTSSKVLDLGRMRTFAGQVVFELEAFERG